MFDSYGSKFTSFLMILITKTNKMTNLDEEINEEDVPINTRPAYETNKEKCDISAAEEQLNIAVNEWENVSTVIPITVGLPRCSKPVSCEEILNYFQSQDMNEYLKNIKPTVKRKLMAAIYHRIFGPPKIKTELLAERNLVFAIAQYPYDTQNALHLRLIRTIYKNLTGIATDCPQYGSHWENIGFQGCNPSTDLRGVGFLGLYHLLYLTLNPKTKALTKDIYKLSHHETQHFPFCVMSINVTRIALEALREDILNKEINKNGAVMSVVSNFYAGCFYYLYSVWKQQGKTIMDSGYVIQDVTKFSKKNPRIMLESLNNYQQNAASVPNELVQFSDIGDITLSVTTS